MGRGRTRDPVAASRILDAAFTLMSAEGRLSVSMDEIAGHAGVGKQTIYRWWPSRGALAIDALLRATLDATPFPDTGDTYADLDSHLEMVAEMFASPSGRMIKGIVGDAQRDQHAAADFVTRFWEPRRTLSRRCLRHGIATGQVRSDIDLDLVLDAIYGPLWVRLLIDHAAIDIASAHGALALIWPSVRAFDAG
ncbi:MULTISPECIES: TetR/AcrR family transcriptional regulator [unclassified Gordonia (in: high G+C Gram-positive bacteria)]